MCGGAVNRQPGYRARNLQRKGQLHLRRRRCRNSHAATAVAAVAAAATAVAETAAAASTIETLVCAIKQEIIVTQPQVH